jgi:hypothetical protein
MNKGLIVTKKFYNLDYNSVPGVVLVRSAPTTFHNLLWTTLLRYTICPVDTATAVSWAGVGLVN